jgi:hypothetical protein
MISGVGGQKWLQINPKPYESMVVLLKKRFVWFGGYWSGGWCRHCFGCSGVEKVKFATWYVGPVLQNGVAELLHGVRSPLESKSQRLSADKICL